MTDDPKLQMAPLPPLPPRKSLDAVIENAEAVERFWKQVDKAEGGCWTFRGSVHSGYGRFHLKRTAYLAHRVSYRLHRGHIPDDLVIDHICRNRACVNPEHLRAVSNRTNVLQNSESASAFFAARTHCSEGHPLSGENLVIYRKTVRFCKICLRRSHRDWKSRSNVSTNDPDYMEAQRLLSAGDTLKIAEAVAAHRFVTHLDISGFFDTALRSFDHLKGPTDADDL